jgi:hypothetical protein
MSGGETEEKPSGWTTDTWAQHTRALGDEHDRFLEERDRRLTEVAAEREKALRIKDEGVKETSRVKEEADKEARQLARDAQTYKDEQANRFREQLNTERGTYVTQEQFKPISDYVAGQVSVRQNQTEQRLNANLLVAVLGLVLAAAIFAFALR